MEHHHDDGHGHIIRWAFWYDLLLKLLTFGREGVFREAILDKAAVTAGDRVLDVGCGTGTLAIAAKRRVGAGGAVAGIDPAEEMIARARSKAARAGLTVDFQVGAAQKLPFADGAFDVVLSSLMLHHLPEAMRKDGVAEMRRVLKPNGRLLIVELIREPGLAAAVMPARFSHSKQHSHAYEEAKSLMAQAGFREAASGGFEWRFAAWVLGTPAT